MEKYDIFPSCVSQKWLKSYPRKFGKLIASGKYNSKTNLSPKDKLSWSLKHPKKNSEKRGIRKSQRGIVASLLLLHIHTQA